MGWFVFNGGLQLAAIQSNEPQRLATGGMVYGPGGPKEDKIPAMLSNGEFVMTARAVEGMGNGNRSEGAKKMYAMMRKFENGRA